MDVKKTLFLLTLTVSLISCIPEKEENYATVAPETAPSCSQTQIQGQYIATWKDGTQSIEYAQDRKDLIENFVKPNLEELKLVEADQIVTVDLPRESEMGSLTSNQTWGVDKIQAQAAWDQGVTGQGVVVAVIDSGVEIDHPELENQIFVNLAEANGVAGIDDDGNGYVDDIQGWNFHDRIANNNDEVGHGTHVSGIIAADHSVGLALGAAPESKILPLDFMGYDQNNDFGGSVSAAIEAIHYAVGMGAKIINASWGSSACSQSLQETIKKLDQQNILFVAAAGNSGRNISVYPEFPAAYEHFNQITIGASTANDITAGFSNYGMLVDFVAPGASIFSTYTGGSEAYLSGTSMAAPFVSAAAALLWSYNPNLDSAKIKKALMDSTTSGPYYVKTRGQMNVSLSLDKVKTY